MNPYINGWLAEKERGDYLKRVAAPSGCPNIVAEEEAISLIVEAAQTRLATHPWTMAEELFQRGIAPYRRLTTWNQDANNCAGHATARAVDAFAMIRAWIGDRYEMELFENFVPWVWGVGKNEAGQTGTGGATMTAMLEMIARNGVLPVDTPELPAYEGTSNRWAKRYGKQAQNAPYSPFWTQAKRYRITVANLPQDDELFYLACRGGYAIAFGTSQQIKLDRETCLWKASGSWMHAMAAYGYDPENDRVGIDNSHGDGLGWADRQLLRSVVDRARYFDAFVILDITPRPGKPDWNLIGKS